MLGASDNGPHLRVDTTNQERHRGNDLNIQRVLPLDPLPEIQGYNAFLSLWDRKRGDNQLPSRADFKIDDFTGWFGSIAISDVEGDDLRFRLYGTHYTALLGVDLTGQLLCTSMDESLVERSRRYFETLRSGPHIGHTTGVAPTVGRDFIAFDVLDLPLAEDGYTVNRFLHVLRAGLHRR